MKICGNCRYFDGNVTPTLCRCHLPVVVVTSTVGPPETFWPVVDADEWCGLWMPQTPDGNNMSGEPNPGP